jgi:hypothetical protein
MGSIKSTAGDYYNVYPDKLDAFQSGQNYTIEYTVSDQGFKSFKKFAEGSGPVRIGNLAAARAAGPTMAQAPRAGDTKAEEMFVMGFMNRCYQGGYAVPLQDQLVEQMRTLRAAWREAFTDAPMPKPVERPSPVNQTIAPDDLNDEIPF